MGAGSSKQESIVTNTQVTKSTFDYVSNTQNTSQTNIRLSQAVDISGGEFYCNLSIGQKIDGDIKVLAKFDEKSTMDLIMSVINDVESKVKQSAKIDAGLGSNPGKVALMNQAKTEIINETSTQITSETINAIMATVVQDQTINIKNLKLDPCGITAKVWERFQPPDSILGCLQESDCTIDQDIVLRFTSEQLGSKISDIINKNETANKIKADMESESDQKGQGIMGIVIAIVVIIGLFLIGAVTVYVVFFRSATTVALSPAGQNAVRAGTTMATGGGANAAKFLSK